MAGYFNNYSFITICIFLLRELLTSKTFMVTFFPFYLKLFISNIFLFTMTYSSSYNYLLGNIKYFIVTRISVSIYCSYPITN